MALAVLPWWWVVLGRGAMELPSCLDEVKASGGGGRKIKREEGRGGNVYGSD
jgi:hypothetical protein